MDGWFALMASWVPSVSWTDIKLSLYILTLAYLQNISFSVVSRARNRNNRKYIVISSALSNGIWFLTFRELVLGKMNWMLFIPYTIGTVTGSLHGAVISMYIERRLNASSDAHLRNNDSRP